LVVVLRARTVISALGIPTNPWKVTWVAFVAKVAWLSGLVAQAVAVSPRTTNKRGKPRTRFEVIIAILPICWQTAIPEEVFQRVTRGLLGIFVR
jgi:hypothetical protein